MNIIQKIKLNNPEKENLQKTLYEIDTLSKRWTGIQKSGESDSEAIQKNIETTIAASLSLENIPYTALQIQKIIARQKATNDKKQSLITGYDTVLKALTTIRFSKTLSSRYMRPCFPTGKYIRTMNRTANPESSISSTTKHLLYSAVTKRYRSITKYGIWSNGPTTN